MPVFTRVLEAWAAKHAVRQASIAVRHDGRIVHQAGLGEDPRTPVLIASSIPLLAIESGIGDVRLFARHGAELSRRPTVPP
jgi:hypothetical protein